MILFFMINKIMHEQKIISINKNRNQQKSELIKSCTIFNFNKQRQQRQNRQNVKQKVIRLKVYKTQPKPYSPPNNKYSLASHPKVQQPATYLTKQSQSQHIRDIKQKDMFSFLLIVFQLFFVIMIGVFYRSYTYSAQDTQYVTLGLITVFAFVLMNSTYRKLSLFSLLLLIFISFFTIELNILFVTFWASCFTAFSKQINISTSLLVNSVYAALAVVITCMDFLGLFQYWQIFSLISFIMTIGYGLSSAVAVFGLDTYDGGSAISVFLYSGMCSLMIWLMSVRGKISILQHKKSQSYVNYALGFIGVAIALFSWPVLNVGGSAFTYLNTNLSSSLSLNNSAYVNTLMALSVPLIISTFLSTSQTQSEKLHPKVYIESFINAGIIVSSFNDVSLHPVAGMTLSLFSTIVTVLVNKYLVVKTTVRNESDFKMVLMKFSKILFRIIWSFLSVCIGAIVVTTRDNTSVWLLYDSQSHTTKAGLMVASWLISLCIGAVFGIICALCINCYINYRRSASNEDKTISIVDQIFFQDMDSQIFPIYRDILEVQPDKTYEEDLTRRVLHQSLLMQQQVPVNIYETRKSSHESNNSKQVQKQTIVLKNDFSRSNLNLNKKDINLSAMKIKKNQEPIAEENFNNKRINEAAKREIVDSQYSPIKRLQVPESKFESLRPMESRVEEPKQLRAIASNSKLSEIHVIEEDLQDMRKNPTQSERNPIKKLTFDDEINEDEIQMQGISRVNS